MTKEEFMQLPKEQQAQLYATHRKVVTKMFFLGQHTNPKRNAERKAKRASKNR